MTAVRNDGSAAQPTLAIASYMGSGSAEQPAVESPTHKPAFYNVGWNASSKKHKPAWLALEVSEIVTERNVDAIGISEVFNQKEDYLKGVSAEQPVDTIVGHLESRAEHPRDINSAEESVGTIVSNPQSRAYPDKNPLSQHC